jgi:hypothetical protein
MEGKIEVRWTLAIAAAASSCVWKRTKQTPRDTFVCGFFKTRLETMVP